MKILIVGLLVLAGCAPSPSEHSFSVNKPGVVVVEGVTDADAKVSAKQYQTGISISLGVKK